MSTKADFSAEEWDALRRGLVAGEEAVRAGGAVVSVAAGKVDPANDKKLVHITALATTESARWRT